MKTRHYITAVIVERDQLKVECRPYGIGITFAVKNTEANRRAYVIDRAIAVDIQPERIR